MFSSHNQSICHIFLIEFWERFSYYGINAILILYIINTFSVTSSYAYLIFGAYGAMVYSSSVLGGVISDKFLGTYYSIIIGGMLIAIGHILLLLPTSGHAIFYLSLSIIITGTGLFKPSIAAIIGECKYRNGQARQKGFTMAYVGSNVGTIVAPIICSTVALYYGWLEAFALSGLGMLIGLIFFYKAKVYFSKESFIVSS